MAGSAMRNLETFSHFRRSAQLHCIAYGWLRVTCVRAALHVKIPSNCRNGIVTVDPLTEAFRLSFPRIPLTACHIAIDKNGGAAPP